MSTESCYCFSLVGLKAADRKARNPKDVLQTSRVNLAEYVHENGPQGKEMGEKGSQGERPICQGEESLIEQRLQKVQMPAVARYKQKMKGTDEFDRKRNSDRLMKNVRVEAEDSWMVKQNFTDVEEITLWDWK